VEVVAAEIATAMPEPFIMVVVVLKGAFIFGADLLRALSRLGWHPPC
jgi:hypoxanthine-guanine phosphoribosyltransferase